MFSVNKLNFAQIGENFAFNWPKETLFIGVWQKHVDQPNVACFFLQGKYQADKRKQIGKPREMFNMLKFNKPTLQTWDLRYLDEIQL